MTVWIPYSKAKTEGGLCPEGRRVGVGGSVPSREAHAVTDGDLRARYARH